MATETFTVQTSKPEDTESNILNQNNYDQIEDKTSERKTNPERKVARLKKFKALMMKNSMQFFRYYTGLAFAVIFPIVQISTFYIGVAKDIKTLEIGVINDDAGNCDYNNNFGNIWYDEEMLTCHFGNLSCKFLHDLGNSIATQDYYNNISEATVDVKDGKLVGMIHFHQNFSKALERRLEAFAFTEESDLIATEIQIFLDMADSQVGNYMKKKLFDRFIAIYEDVMKDCRLSTKLANVPIRFEDPIYGTSDPAYADFMAPAYIITLAFVLATIVSTSLIVTDRLEGVWYRSLVQGVQTWEILLSHILCQTIIVIIHTAMILGLSFLAWGLECKGSIFPVILITFLSGMCGLMYGFSLSILCNDHVMAHFASAGSFLPLTLLGGAMWPVEGMPKVLRWISLSLPMTFPAISLRHVFFKAYSFFEPEVYNGTFVLIAWILLLFTISVIGVKRKSS